MFKILGLSTDTGKKKKKWNYYTMQTTWLSLAKGHGSGELSKDWIH